MAKVSGSLFDQFSGKLYGVVFRNTANGSVAAKAPRKASKPRRTEGQADVRCRFANASANYRLYAGKLEKAFESKNAGASDYNYYIGVNYSNAVYITRGMRVAGCCVLADYTFAVGSLEPIGAELNASDILVSDLNLGNLVIGENTTVADLSMALIQNNESWDDGDQLTFFYGQQYLDSQGMPRATMVAKKVILSVDDETPLWNVVGSEGFASVPSTGSGAYVLAMSVALNNSGAAWVHSRDKNSGNILVSTQRLVVVSDILDDYRTRAAMKASAASYGGITSNSVYLNPGSANLTDFGGSTSSPTGGSSTGSETVTVMAPEISGTTPFAESTSVTIQGPQGSSIYYTIDGSTPTSESTLYSEAFSLTDSATVKAVAVLNGVSSEVSSKTFTKSSGNGGDGLDQD